MWRGLARIALALGFILGASGHARAQAVLEPPYGLHWGDSPEKLIEWAEKHALDTEISLPGDQPALRVVKISSRKETLPGTQAKSIEGRFFSGRLFELAVHYGDDGAGADGVEARFGTLKKELTAEYGELAADQQERKTEDHFETHTLSYHREPVHGLFLLLVYSEMTDQLRQRREALFSLIYRNDNLRQDLERKLQDPAAETGK